MLFYFNWKIWLVFNKNINFLENKVANWNIIFEDIIYNDKINIKSYLPNIFFVLNEYLDKSEYIEVIENNKSFLSSIIKSLTFRKYFVRKKQLKEKKFFWLNWILRNKLSNEDFLNYIFDLSIINNFYDIKKINSYFLNYIEFNKKYILKKDISYLIKSFYFLAKFEKQYFKKKEIKELFKEIKEFIRKNKRESLVYLKDKEDVLKDYNDFVNKYYYYFIDAKVDEKLIFSVFFENLEEFFLLNKSNISESKNEIEFFIDFINLIKDNEIKNKIILMFEDINKNLQKIIKSEEFIKNNLFFKEKESLLKIFKKQLEFINFINNYFLNFWNNYFLIEYKLKNFISLIQKINNLEYKILFLNILFSSFILNISKTKKQAFVTKYKKIVSEISDFIKKEIEENNLFFIDKKEVKIFLYNLTKLISNIKSFSFEEIYILINEFFVFSILFKDKIKDKEKLNELIDKIINYLLWIINKLSIKITKNEFLQMLSFYIFKIFESRSFNYLLAWKESFFDSFELEEQLEKLIFNFYVYLYFSSENYLKLKKIKISYYNWNWFNEEFNNDFKNDNKPEIRLLPDSFINLLNKKFLKQKIDIKELNSIFGDKTNEYIELPNNFEISLFLDDNNNYLKLFKLYSKLSAEKPIIYFLNYNNFEDIFFIQNNNKVDDCIFYVNHFKKNNFIFLKNIKLNKSLYNLFQWLVWTVNLDIFLKEKIWYIKEKIKNDLIFLWFFNKLDSKEKNVLNYFISLFSLLLIKIVEIYLYVYSIGINNHKIIKWLEEIRNKIDLFYYQKEVIREILKWIWKDNYYIKAHTWWWKTIAFLYLLSLLKIKTLIVTDREKLLLQHIEEFLNLTWLSEDDITIIWTSKNNYEENKNKEIIFSLTNWIKKIKNEEFWLVIIDELHKLSEAWYKNILSLKYDLLVWFSATPKINFLMKDEKYTLYLFNKKIFSEWDIIKTRVFIYWMYDKKLKELRNNYIDALKKEKDIITIDKDWKIKRWKNVYSNFRSSIIRNKEFLERYEKIFNKIILKHIVEWNYILLLSDRLEELEIFYELLKNNLDRINSLRKEIWEVDWIIENKKIKLREFKEDDILFELKWKIDINKFKEKWWILLWTAAKYWTWINVKLLDTVILLNHISTKPWWGWLNLLEQINWRLTRYDENKIQPKFIIIEDIFFSNNISKIFKILKKLTKEEFIKYEKVFIN